MKAKIELIEQGTVTTPKGFQAGAICAGIKEKAGDKLDLSILFSKVPCVAAGVFTKNKIKAAPVVLSRERLHNNNAIAVVMNSGCANACTGEQGYRDAIKMTELAAEKIGVSSEDVLVASTGVIGELLPMERIKSGVNNIVFSTDGGSLLAKAIMTTDTVPKEVAVRVGNDDFIIGGVTKGSGMIHPNMGTMLCILTTDAAVEPGFLQKALQNAVDISFNMISVDGDTSTNDTAVIMANGLAGNKVIAQDSRQADIFQQALNQVCIYLAKAMARDGEGAGKLIEVMVKNARS
ncbi:MAG: bifunctional ornithine acetyltransferase/N-acetylglutamate synthase, partial [Dehalococcoidales bacterium]|nr:bifunctional ornithine acetyltransferase/N-acetylglutamate synthase [Dehalococcoidales bacterium]